MFEMSTTRSNTRCRTVTQIQWWHGLASHSADTAITRKRIFILSAMSV